MFHLKKSIIIFGLLVWSLIGCVFLIIPMATHAADGDLILQIPVPDNKNPNTYTNTITLCESDGSCNGIANYFGGLFIWLVRAVAVIAVVVLMVGGLQWLTARGDSGQTQKAKKIISNALIGLTLTLTSYMILYFINPTLTKWAPLRLTPVQNIDLPISAIQDAGKEEPQTTTPGTTPETNSPKEIILHHTVSEFTDCATQKAANIAALSSLADDPNPICHYWIKRDGTKVQCAPPNVNSDYCSYGANTHHAVGIEIVSNGTLFTLAQINTTAALVKSLVETNNIPKTNESKNLIDNNHTSALGGVFSHSQLCANLPYGGTDVRTDPPENIFETILSKAGITYTPGQPRCGDSTVKGIIN